MNNLDLQWDEFEVRLENQVRPGLDYDIYISSGGPEVRWKAKAPPGKMPISTGSVM